eukprot:CAMPEP_0196139208 /NCGR_PEP_ID=MMETSP0910-20130528/6570_1 /TAXON_ID=49265 /ORGANISM="Thalassiosira rotula, Strain GSO102" /LENGTH=41 /DNA_ID= /DNA_START= /DNA_END= /DNA_ORIENTATION=
MIQMPRWSVAFWGYRRRPGGKRIFARAKYPGLRRSSDNTSS